jgi:hypothetical protein
MTFLTGRRSNVMVGDADRAWANKARSQFAPAIMAEQNNATDSDPFAVSSRLHANPRVRRESS